MSPARVRSRAMKAEDLSLEAFVVELLEASFSSEPPFDAVRKAIPSHEVSNADDRTLRLIRDAVGDLVAAIVTNDAEALRAAAKLRYLQLGLDSEGARLLDALEIVRGHVALKRRVGTDELTASLLGALDFHDPAFSSLEPGEVEKLLQSTRLETKRGKHAGGSRNLGPAGLLAKLIERSGAFGGGNAKKKILNAEDKAKRAAGQRKRAAKSRKGLLR